MIQATAQVAPMPNRCAPVLACVRMPWLAAWMLSRNEASGRWPSLAARFSLIWLTAISAATSPARCPPMPSLSTASRAGVAFSSLKWYAETA